MNESRKEKILSFLPLLRNKYVLSGLVFIIWVGFFDQNNLVDRFSLARRLKDLERQREHYQNEILENRTRMEELESNRDNLEKFAREQYLMKRPDEEIFIIIEK